MLDLEVAAKRVDGQARRLVKVVERLEGEEPHVGGIPHTLVAKSVGDDDRHYGPRLADPPYLLHEPDEVPDVLEGVRRVDLVDDVVAERQGPLKVPNEVGVDVPSTVYVDVALELPGTAAEVEPDLAHSSVNTSPEGTPHLKRRYRRLAIQRSSRALPTTCRVIPPR